MINNYDQQLDIDTETYSLSVYANATCDDCQNEISQSLMDTEIGFLCSNCYKNYIGG